ncbi:TolC family protein, partial [bacterium]|nr:TolC family protein [bacterium]
EVEVAAARSRELAAQREAYRAQLAAADAALEQSRYRYVNGLADYQAVLTALGARQQAELGLIETHRQLIAARLALYDALGGAWTKNIGEEG